MLRTLIIDDEKHIREMLSGIVNEYCSNIDLLGTAKNIAEAEKSIKEWKPDLILLDINLPDGSGFDLLARLDESAPMVIFITAYNEYAIKAFKFSAVDYIMKPINVEELIEALKRCEMHKEQDNLSSKLKVLLKNMDSSSSESKKIVLKTQESIHVVKVTEIVRCLADHNYTEFFLENGKKLLVSRTLKEYELLLNDYDFFRPHQSHLINMNFISRFDKVDGGTLVMSDGSRVPVSKRKKDELLQLFNQL
ncbi:MAG: LytTR family DNA-binding domain-containing protein [Prolixibacteraceae bacterium]|jgi:two-component system LytT family response regulator|nr:LytTR family DNA-binding domain-containing protein [Prolixibacteraceae bacterium]